MKVSSVFIVAAAIITGQASAQLAIAGRRNRRGNYSTKQRNVGKGEERRLQENDESSLSMADSFVVQGTHSGSKKDKKKSKSTSRSGKGETCSIEDLSKSTYIPRVDIASLGLAHSGMPGFGYSVNNLPVTLTFKRLGRVALLNSQGLFVPPSAFPRLKGSMDVNFCLADMHLKLVAVQTGFIKDGIVPFTLMPIFIPTASVSSVSDASAGSIDEKNDENGQGERRTEGFPEEYPELADILGAKGNNNGGAEKMLISLSQFAIYGEYNCKTREIMFGGGASLIGISLAINEPAVRRSTRVLQNRFDENGCFIPQLNRDEQRDADWD